MTCAEIYDYYETQNIVTNEHIWQIAFQQFLEINNLNFPASIQKNSSEMLYYFNEVFKQCPWLQKSFFEILHKLHYNMKLEIVVAISDLGNCCDFSKIDEVIKAVEISPIINKITFDGNSQFTIDSTLGTFTFMLASFYFRKYPMVQGYMRIEKLLNECHNHTYYLSSLFPKMTSITSLCSRDFIGHYYHSYTYNPIDQNIIDLTKNCVIDKNTYDFLFEPIEILVIPNEDIPAQLQNVNSDLPEDTCRVLKIALYQQYLSQFKKDKQKVLMPNKD